MCKKVEYSQNSNAYTVLSEVSDKLSAVRSAMAAAGVDALIVSNADPHSNEYVAPHWECRQWLTHMKGSNGTVLVTADWCGLWTDSRYYEMATEAMAGTEIKLIRMSDIGVPTIEEWLKSHFDEAETVAFNGAVTSLKQARAWTKSFDVAGLQWRSDLDLISPLWVDRPPEPKGELFLVGDEYTGQSIESKIAAVRGQMKGQKLQAYLLGRTDESCWLLNFRGTDMATSSTPYVYTLITMDEVLFFVDADKLTDAAKEKFAAARVSVKEYGEIGVALQRLDALTRLLIVPQYASYELAKAAEHCVQIEDRAIVTDLKAVKNETEVGHLKRALIDDGAALVKFYTWLNRSMQAGERLTEFDADKKLLEFRSEVDGFRHVSFDSIVGYGPNGALNHYSAEEATAAGLKPESLLLVDSGGSYLHGSTDTTRTNSLGVPTQQQKDDYTLVLSGMIELILLEFAEGSTGAQLDGVCRQPMWQHGRHFKHGTGHGVGFGLEIHEGPQGISGLAIEKMKLGMITTIEPGCYRSGEYGIRIENMVHTVLSQENEFGRFFKFENLTFCPINVDLVEPSLLSARQLDWLNNYHVEVLEKLSPLLNDEAREWLVHECRPVVADQS
ncbi:MAG: aminopeptidase P family protein [Lentimonas sp.]